MSAEHSPLSGRFALRAGQSSRLLLTLVTAFACGFALAASAAAAPPVAGIFVPGQSLGGVSLGMTKPEVLQAWGRRHGVCRNCSRPTWYFNYAEFQPQGVGVVFRRGRVVQAFTLWKPEGWRTPGALLLGAPVEQVLSAYGPLDKRVCSGYYALLKPGRKAVSVFYVDGTELWGFGLMRPEASPCL